MEHWIKVVLGTIVGCVLTATFYFLFDFFFQRYRDSLDKRSLKRHSDGSVGFSSERDTDVPLIIRHSNAGHSSREEIERLIYEEHEGAESVGVLYYDPETNKLAGIYADTEDYRVEYFVEDLPQCCRERDDENSSWRSVLSAVSVWAPSWRFNDSVNFLIHDTKIVKEVTAEGTAKHRKIRQISDKYGFNIYVQWNENFMCDNVSNNDLWTNLVIVSKNLIHKSDENNDDETIWSNSEFPCLHWDRRKIIVDLEHFHLLPHSGDITPPEEPKPLIDI